VKLGSTESVPLSDNHPSVFRIKDLGGRVALDIRQDGTVLMGQREIHVFVLAGQSNMSGRGTPYSATLDPIDRRILQYGAVQQRITPATVPLDMHDTALGLSPATVFAREYLKSQPSHVSVLLVPAAHGGTGFTTASPLRWDITDSAGLYAQMKTQVAGALTAVAAELGGTPTVKGFLWHQGEADTALTESAYAAYFDAMATDLRTTYGATLPIVVGEMSPDWTAANPSTAGVAAAHIQTPARFENAGFAYADPNTGKLGDTVHFARTGVERLGASMHRAYKRAIMNVAGDPAPPPTVTATRANGVLTIKWEQAPSRVTSYVVEYKVDAGAWTAAPAPTPALNTTTTVSNVTGSTILVRVATVNAAGTSATTQPVTVQDGILDTGWRDISVNAQTGVTLIRRIGSTVWLNFKAATVPTLGNYTYTGIIPAGFRPYMDQDTSYREGAGIFLGKYATCYTTGNVIFWNVAANNTNVTTYVTFPTNAAWPATLPGVAY
jgi:hypothetical protein